MKNENLLLKECIKKIVQKKILESLDESDPEVLNHKFDTALAELISSVYASVKRGDKNLINQPKKELVTLFRDAIGLGDRQAVIPPEPKGEERLSNGTFGTKVHVPRIVNSWEIS